MGAVNLVPENRALTCKYRFALTWIIPFFKGVLRTRFGALELKIGCLESQKIIIGSLEVEKLGPYRSTSGYLTFSFKKLWLCQHFHDFGFKTFSVILGLQENFRKTRKRKEILSVVFSGIEKLGTILAGNNLIKCMQFFASALCMIIA